MQSRTIVFLALVLTCLVGCKRSEDKRDASSDTPHVGIDGAVQPDLSTAIDGGTGTGGMPGDNEAGTMDTATGGAGGGAGGVSGSGGTGGGTGSGLGSGGATGSGGHTEAGGAVGSGGGPETGGVVTASGGVGGGTGAGGFVGVGGTVGGGGSHGLGGAIGAGGNPGVGGTFVVGGSGGALTVDAGLDGEVDSPGESEAGTLDAEENPQDAQALTVDAPDAPEAPDTSGIDTAVADAGVPMVGCLYEGTYTIPSQAQTSALMATLVSMNPPTYNCSWTHDAFPTTVSITVADGKLSTALAPIPTMANKGGVTVPMTFPNWTITSNTPSKLTATGGIGCGSLPMWILSSFTLDVDCQTGVFTLSGSCEADWPSTPPCLWTPDFTYSLSGSATIVCSGQNPTPVWCADGDTP